MGDVSALQNTMAQSSSADDTGSELLASLLDVGEALLLSGADVNLVEEAMQETAFARGASKADIFALSSIIIASIHYEGHVYSQNRRIIDNPVTDFSRQQDLLAACKAFAKENAEGSQGHREAKRSETSIRDAVVQFSNNVACIASHNIPTPMFYIGGFLSAAGFALFFGGAPLAAFMSGLFGVLVCLMIRHIQPHVTNTNVFSFVASFVSGLGIALIGKYCIPDLDTGMVIVGTIMILIPGIGLTSSVKDLLSGDMITGMMGTASSFITATVLATGYIAAFLVVSPGSFATPQESSPHELVQLFSALIAVVGYALFFNAKPRQIAALTAGGVLTWIVFQVAGSLLPDGSFVDTFIAAVFASLWSIGLGRFFKTPSMMFFYTTVITLVPGRMLYFTMAAASAGEWAQFATFGLSTLGTVVAIICGFAAVWAIFGVWKKFIKAQRARLRASKLAR